MTAVFLTFIVACALSLTFTPGAKRLGARFGAVDAPSERKVHVHAIPRIGGLAIIGAFFLALAASAVLSTQVADILVVNRRNLLAAVGAVAVFSVGFVDDFRRLGPRIKFLVQLLAASLAYYGGLRIEGIAVEGIAMEFGILSYLITVFWFLLLINAINLIDGLDGLAAGVAFFTSAVMVVMAIMHADYLVALEFAALGGALLGFLRYNFNPASVFMGDGGSYFIGYTIAALAILGSLKTQVGATLLIPLLALGVPIFDTILAPLRRFIRGREMFQPDKGHIHHQLVAMGLSSRRAVLIIYGISFSLCLLAIVLVNIRNEMAGLLLIVLAGGAFLIVRKLGYLEYLAADKFFGWLRDLSDDVGFTRDRRSFLSLQLEIGRTRSIEALWDHTCRALEMLRFDRAELHIYERGAPDATPERDSASSFGPGASTGGERRRTAQSNDGNQAVWETTEQRTWGTRRVWSRGHHRREADVQGNGHLRIEIPLGSGISSAARLILIKDLSLEPIQPYTLRRVEYLRRSVMNAMKRLHQGPAKRL